MPKRTRLKKGNGSTMKKKRLPKKVSFIWKNNSGWTWTAEKYEGNGIFFGKVTSPYVPEGEYGTWYLWEIERDGNAKLIEGDAGLLADIKKRSEKVAKTQQLIMG